MTHQDKATYEDTSTKSYITAINPEYMPSQINEWEVQMSALEISRRKCEINQECYQSRAHWYTQGLAAEIISETACSRYWGMQEFPKEEHQWPELESAIFFTMAEIDLSMKSAQSDRLSVYDPPPYELLPRGMRVRAAPPCRGIIETP